MTSKAALLALLTIWGVGLGGSTLTARADDLAADESPSEAKVAPSVPAPELTNRIWVKTGDDELSGMVRIFLTDGTLVQDSPWDRHRLSSWKMLPPDRLTWSEDGKDISARIASLTPERLTLVLDRRGGPVEEHYRAAPMSSAGP